MLVRSRCLIIKKMEKLRHFFEKNLRNSKNMSTFGPKLQIYILTTQIMKKLNYLFGAAAMAIAMVMTSCAVDDLPVDPNEPKIHDGDELATAITKYCDVINGVPTLTLPAGVSVVLNEAVELKTPLVIKGDEAAPAKIKIGAEGKFIGGLEIANAEIDASEMGSPLVTLGTADADEWSFASVGLVNVTMTGLKKAIVYSGCKNYDVSLIVENSRIQVAADVTVFDFTKGSFPIEFNVKNSTFWAPEATGKAFFSSQSGQKATEMEGGSTTFDFENSTFYNLTKGKNFFTHRQNSQTWLTYTVKDCIFVNCGKSGQVIAGMNGGGKSKNPTWDVSGNVFNFDGADTSADEANGDDDEPIKDSKAVVVNFADAANGDFTQAEAKAGDPIWMK